MYDTKTALQLSATRFLRGLKRIRTAVDGFADRWLSHSPIRPTSSDRYRIDMANLRGEIVTIPIRSANIRKNIKPPKFCGDIDSFCENYYLYIVRTPVFAPRRGRRTLFGARRPRVRGGYADEGVRGYTITQLFYDRRRYSSHLRAEARRKRRGASIEMLRLRRGDIFGVGG